MRVTEVWTYPVKSFGGTSRPEVAVEPWGFAGDRRWAVVDPDDGVRVTAREVNHLLLVGAEQRARGLRLSAAGHPPLDVSEPGDDAEVVVARVGRSEVRARAAGAAADAWASAVAGRPVRLVHMADPAQRPTNPAFGRDDDRVSLADGYPVLLTSEASLRALGDAVVEGSEGAEEPPGMRRFRPNLVVDGLEAWAEDDWRVLRVGGPDGVVLRNVKACDRCVMTTVDPDTAERGREPLRTLARVRRAGGATWFGVNLVPDVGTPGDGPVPVVRVGDDVEVLDAVAPGSGPQGAA